MTKPSVEIEVYGLMAEFSTPNEIVSAAKRVREAGYREFDAYTPFGIEELAEPLGCEKSGAKPAVHMASSSL